MQYQGSWPCCGRCGRLNLHYTCAFRKRVSRLGSSLRPRKFGAQENPDLLGSRPFLGTTRTTELPPLDLSELISFGRTTAQLPELPPPALELPLTTINYHLFVLKTLIIKTGSSVVRVVRTFGRSAVQVHFSQPKRGNSATQSRELRSARVSGVVQYWNPTAIRSRRLHLHAQVPSCSLAG